MIHKTGFFHLLRRLYCPSALGSVCIGAAMVGNEQLVYMMIGDVHKTKRSFK